MGNALKDRIVLVTGGTRGIGAAITRRFAADGARVVAAYRSDRGAAARVEDEIRSAGGDCLVVQGDIGEQKISTPSSGQRCSASIASTFWSIALRSRPIVRWAPWTPPSCDLSSTPMSSAS